MLTPLAINPFFDELVTSLSKLDALLKIASSMNMSEYDMGIQMNYFWVMSDILVKAKKACEELARVILHSAPFKPSSCSFISYSQSNSS